MRTKKWLLVAISLTFFFLLAQTAIATTSIGVEKGYDTQTIEGNQVIFTDSQTSFGPGSQVPMRTPVEGEYYWVSSVEPVKARWTFYSPGFKQVYQMEKQLSLKQRISSGEHAGKWAYADETAFTIPAFAEKGTWIAKPEVVMADGSVHSGASAEEPNIKYVGFPVTSSGGWVENLFGAPWYALNIQMPPVFWFPLILLWGPALFIGICYISPQVSETFKRGITRLQEARKKW